ncbi:MBL fold metallo-hydrolase [Bradyrhizobium sp. LHD-71]|uniref:MBL fold metallo-hydrolase n=1 Tax=Bradyrhizobium sp. LHD-71 TaxID=3072141 RepID=UPI00281055BB|nr:MBL fold metallo-hydrolase [Bradyrhizobium sp. LHD-71]MDQ8732497.1 MBL fold metallo-hydrolase [Bradyrhizobium sp. LHD-71]
MSRLVVLTVRFLSLALLAVSAASAARAEGRTASECLAVAQRLPGVIFARYGATAAAASSVTITYVGHSTYQIETPADVVIATDYNGVYRPPRLPTVVTMNRAHTTHYTLNPDPRIAHVLHGWADEGAAKHAVTVGDVFIRNVPTDIRNFRAYGFGRGDLDLPMQKDGNSIFIFEVAGLCIGHLGHLHHKLDESHIAAIGRLDVLMVPIDDSVTMTIDGMAEIVKRLRASIVLPMHRLGTPLQEFVGRVRGQFEVDLKADRSFSVSLDSLPKAPTVVILDGV